jgi:3-methyl-2-oxobutanoate hydroxymethyltransferase
MLGITQGGTPKFVKNFLTESGDIKTAVNNFISAVKQQEFPSDQHSY